jgi:hypothetical protein
LFPSLHYSSIAKVVSFPYPHVFHRSRGFIPSRTDSKRLQALDSRPMLRLQFGAQPSKSIHYSLARPSLDALYPVLQCIHTFLKERHASQTQFESGNEYAASCRAVSNDIAPSHYRRASPCRNSPFRSSPSPSILLTIVTASWEPVLLLVALLEAPFLSLTERCLFVVDNITSSRLPLVDRSAGTPVSLAEAHPSRR